MARQALGKGLEALIPASLPTENTAPGELGSLIPLAEIRTNPYQPRAYFDPVKLTELADSIREQGLLQPVVVRKDGPNSYTLVSGERRFRAVQSLGMARIAALIHEDLTPEQMAEMALIENLQRDDLNAMEEARGYKRIVEELGLTQEEVARKVGKSRAAVANSLRLLTLPPELQQKVEKGTLSMGHVRALLSIDRPEAQKALASAAEREGWSVRQMERAVTEKLPSSTRKAGGSKSPGSFLAPELGAMQDRLRRALGTKVALHSKGAKAKGGSIEIEYYSDEELERLVEFIAPVR